MQHLDDFFDSNSTPSTGCPCADVPTAPNSQQGRSWWPYEPGDWTDMTWHFDLGVIFGMYCWRCLASSCKINGFEPRQFTYNFVFWVHVLTHVVVVSTHKTRLAFFLNEVFGTAVAESSHSGGCIQSRLGRITQTRKTTTNWLRNGTWGVMLKTHANMNVCKHHIWLYE